MWPSWAQQLHPPTRSIRAGVGLVTWPRRKILWGKVEGNPEGRRMDPGCWRQICKRQRTPARAHTHTHTHPHTPTPTYTPEVTSDAHPDTHPHASHAPHHRGERWGSSRPSAALCESENGRNNDTGGPSAPCLSYSTPRPRKGPLDRRVRALGRTAQRRREKMTGSIREQPRSRCVLHLTCMLARCSAITIGSASLARPPRAWRGRRRSCPGMVIMVVEPCCGNGDGYRCCCCCCYSLLHTHPTPKSHPNRHVVDAQFAGV